MIRAHTVAARGTWQSAADRVTLAYDERHRRRIAMQADGGMMFMLDLPQALALRHGDGLVLEDGRIVEVVAKPEPLLAVSGHDARHMARLAWHIGNRHVLAAFEAGRILIRPDNVIAGMLAGLGAEVTDLDAPFDPEAGAYTALPAAAGHRVSQAHADLHGSHHHGHPHV